PHWSRMSCCWLSSSCTSAGSTARARRCALRWRSTKHGPELCKSREEEANHSAWTPPSISVTRSREAALVGVLHSTLQQLHKNCRASQVTQESSASSCSSGYQLISVVQGDRAARY